MRSTYFGPMLVMAVILVCGTPARAQPHQDPYSVFKSAGNSNSPVQPPPGSYLWNQQQRLSSLSDLQQEIRDYRAARNQESFNVQFERNKPGWLKAYEVIPWVGPDSEEPSNKEGREIMNGTRPLRPEKPITDSPPDQEQQILDRSDPHLQGLQHAIGYDARRLGLKIDPSSGTEKQRLDQLSSQIDGEMSKTKTILANANVPFEPPPLDTKIPGPKLPDFAPAKQPASSNATPPTLQKFGAYHTSDGGSTWYLNENSLEKTPIGPATLQHGDNAAPVVEGDYHSHDAGKTWYRNDSSLESVPSTGSSATSAPQISATTPGVGGVLLGGKGKFEEDKDVDAWFDKAEKKTDKKEKPAAKGTGQSQTPPKSK